MKFFRDLAERVVSTYVQVVCGLLIASWGDVINMGTFKAAAVAAIPAALAVVKGLVATRFGEADSASLLPDEADPHEPTEPSEEVPADELPAYELPDPEPAPPEEVPAVPDPEVGDGGQPDEG